jgi:DNA-binding XRE family transcriptional regulator
MFRVSRTPFDVRLESHYLVMRRHHLSERSIPVATTTAKTILDGPLLLAAREKHGLSQEDMGVLLGVTQPAIAHIEAGRNKRLSKLARREVRLLLDLTTETVRRRLATARGEAAEVA